MSPSLYLLAYFIPLRKETSPQEIRLRSTNGRCIIGSLLQ